MNHAPVSFQIFPILVQELTDLPNQVSGDWWVVKGQNCGQEGWPGAYDWYPCQHHRLIELEDGSWINNITYCAGSDSVCSSPIFVTTPIAYMWAPGVIKLDYPPTEAPVSPQVRTPFCPPHKNSLTV